MQEQLEGYRAYLDRLPVSPHTRRAYLARVRGFLCWLANSVDGEEGLNDPASRDFMVRDYKVMLLQSGRTSSTVNAVLAAIDNFYLYKRLGPAKVQRQDLPMQAPRALETDEQRRLLKVFAQCPSLRNRALALVMLMCGLRISEVRALNVGDVLLSIRKHELVVRCGKNAKRRMVPMNTELSAVMREYLSSLGGADPDSPLFVSQKQNRLSVQAIDRVIRQFGKDAGIHLNPHALRHTCLSRLVRAGVDVVTVAEVAGHSRLETTRRYSLPTEAVKSAAMEKLTWCNVETKVASGGGSA